MEPSPVTSQGRSKGSHKVVGKDDRRPHQYMKNRGMPKKGGAGGKGTWGTPGDELLDDYIDPNDPNYDSSEDHEYVLVSSSHESSETKAEREPVVHHVYGGDHPMAESHVVPPPSRKGLNLTEFKAAITAIIAEYFEADDVDEVRKRVAELRTNFFHYELVKRAITMAMDKKDREREQVSVLLSGLYGSVLTMNQIGKGFERLFEVVDDLALDIPDARRIVAQFLARAVVDEILPPSFLTDVTVHRLGGDIVEHAKTLLSISHGTIRLERVWGPGADRTVDDLKADIKLLLEEFLLAGDIKEATRCIRELGVPHFYHEVVKRLIVLSLDKEAPSRTLALELLKSLHVSDEFPLSQMCAGFGRVRQTLSDLELDCPRARELFAEMVDNAKAVGVLPSNWGTEMVSPATDGGAAAAAPAEAEAAATAPAGATGAAAEAATAE